MRTIQKIASKWLNQRRKSISSERAIFQHDNLNIPVRVTRGQRDEEIDDSGSGFSERVIYQDFIVSSHELTKERDTGFWASRVVPTDPYHVSFTPVTPKPGDRIIIGDEIYELAPRDSETPCFKWSDTGGIMFRLYTHLISGACQ